MILFNTHSIVILNTSQKSEKKVVATGRERERSTPDRNASLSACVAREPREIVHYSQT